MQIRAVPEEELAIGADGKRLPFAIVTKDDRRKYVEETGPFGKSRRGRSRSRTATVARKEDPTIESFAQALAFSKARQTEQLEEQEQLQQRASLSRSSSQANLTQTSSSTALAVIDGNASTSAPTATAISLRREPTEVMLYGYAPGQQYAAIDRYERVGSGQIYEDYSRDPPMEHRRYQTSSNTRRYAPLPGSARALTPEEKSKVNAYAGGETWIKVTFDSAEAADKAVYASPLTINGYWVHAELYRGVPPREDRALPAGLEEFSAHPSPSSSATQENTTTPAIARYRSSGALALPSNNNSSTSPDQGASINSDTTTTATITDTDTASSATATGSSLHRPSTTIPSTPITTGRDTSTFCTKIPTARRAKLLPAELALLPTPSFRERYFPAVLAGHGFGGPVPRLEDGRFDYGGASVWWRFWYWVDWVSGAGWFEVSED